MKVNLSSSEWKLMKPLWEQPPRTIMELTAALRTETGWTKNTVITMLSRLEAKGAVRCQEGGRAKLYYPALDRRDAARAETESFLGRVDSRQLTAEDIAELSAILEKAGGGES